MKNRLGRLALIAALVVWALLPAAPKAATVAVAIAADRKIPFNDEWRFFKGEAAGAEQQAFDDAQWRTVRLPHDWAIEGPFDPKFGANTGGLPVSGTGWYRKSFTLPEAAKNRYIAIQFDGAMSNSRVWLNGHDLGGRPYGYSSFSIDLTPYLNFGNAPNIIAVRLTPEDRASRWYPGAGIYRNVWLDVTGPVHVTPWGTYVTTPNARTEGSTVDVKIELRNRQTRDAKVTLRISILDQTGKQVARQMDDLTIPATSVQTADTKLTVTNAQLWDLDRPYLYSVVTDVMDGANVLDHYTTSFGIRTIAFSTDKGFQLNGRTVKFQGVCLHSDLGALGMAVNRRAIERELEILKAAGVNAIRTSHNPPAPELLEYADRLGFVVIDEAFDMWRIAKVANGAAKFFDEWHERDVRDQARRDRNHPSVIMWSIGNEVREQGRPDGWQIAKDLTGLFHQEDPTRPTTAAFDNWQSAIKNELANQVDIPGFNYKPNHYEEILKDHPGWMIYGSETASTVSSRGVYHLPLENYQKHESKQVTSYDVVAPFWAMPPDVEFDYQDRLPNQVLGEFVWTGFDYLGEPTPYSGGLGSAVGDWPARSSYFGMVDLAGFPKDRYYLYQSRWTSKPMVHVLPHWNWAGKEGQEIPVMAYSNADEVELFVNGKSLGRKKRFGETFTIPVGLNVSADQKFATKYRFVWTVPYQPGSIRAVAYRDGKQVAADEIRTAGPPARITLAADRNTIRADGDDLSYITVRVEDRDGNLCPMADNLIHFAITGPASVAGVDNGNAASVEPFQSDQRKAFSGLALVILRSKAAETGRARIVATSTGLTQAAIDITTTR
jgi:beta-galactosidase